MGAGDGGRRTELFKSQRDILAGLKIQPPSRLFQPSTETP